MSIKRRLTLSVPIIIFATIIVSCALNTPIIRPIVKSDSIERIFEKNYTVGLDNSAFIGQPIIKVKDYKIHREKSTQMRASNDFVILGLVTIKGSSKMNYEIIGETTLENKTYTAILIPSPLNQNGLGILFIDEDGSLPKQFGDGFASYSQNIEPPETKFVRGTQEEVVIQSGYVNYELIYAGTDGRSINITYREYTSENQAKSAFFQNLVFEAKAKQIRFRDTIIKIIEVSNEKIVYSIVSDGLIP